MKKLEKAQKDIIENWFSKNHPQVIHKKKWMEKNQISEIDIIFVTASKENLEYDSLLKNMEKNIPQTIQKYILSKITGKIPKNIKLIPISPMRYFSPNWDGR